MVAIESAVKTCTSGLHTGVITGTFAALDTLLKQHLLIWYRTYFTWVGGFQL